MRKNILLWITLLSVLPIWTGCSNETDEQDTSSVPVVEKYDGKPIPISISVINQGNQKGGVQTRSEAQKLVFSQPLNDKFDTGYDIVTTIEPVPESESRAATRSVLAEKRYRLLAYRGDVVSSANFAGQGEYETDASGKGTAVGDQLYLPAGPYTFLCYSIGNNEPIPVFDGTSTIIKVTQGDDFMTCKQSVNVEESDSGDFVVRNEFVRHCVNVILEVSTTGFPDNQIKACAAKMNNLNDVLINWDFSSSETLPNTGTSGSAEFSWTTLNNDTVAASDPQIIFPIKSRDLTVEITELKIGAETIKGVVMRYPGVELSPASEYKVIIALERNYIPVGGYKWAKGNVYKDIDGFHIEPTQGAYHLGMYEGSYFEWNTTDIGLGARNQGEYNYAADPCSLITPKGTWQTPSRLETVALAKIYEWDSDAQGIWFGTAPNRVFLPAVGARAYNGSGSPIYDNDGTYALYSLRDYSPKYNQVLSVDPQGVYWLSSMSRTYGLSIRCVKKQ